MKFSEQWLREWVNPTISTAELVEQITMAGLEVDSVEPVAADFQGVVVASVMQVEQHPNADKLSICQVSNGNEEFQVVCGAPNVRAGLKVALAEVGAVLPDNFKIKKAKIRGAESFGMLCAKEELGLEQHSDNIMELPADAPVGESIRSYLQLDDQCLEVDLTPNRGDCLGIAGLAREVGVLNKMPVTALKPEPVKAVIDDTFPVTVEATTQCPRYLGRIIRAVNVKADTPLWMQERLRRSGIRSIDPVVDITNYVLLELGQPMHAFDLNKLQKGINVRLAKPGEKMTMLDGQLLELKDQTLLITDGSGPIAMAGIMGGANTGVEAQTTDIFLECAYFDAVSIAGKARGYGMHTDASHRYERGVDYQLQHDAMERATQLLLEITGGKAGPVTEAVSKDKLPERISIRLRKACIQQVLGLQLTDQAVEDILIRLGLVVASTESSDGWDVDVPSWRFDLSIEADLIEELARIYGYNNLPVRLPRAEMRLKPSTETSLALSDVRRVLLTRGYYEAVTYSFVDPELQSRLMGSDHAISLANPISSEMSQMRTSMWPGLIQALRHNQNRQQSRIRLFETGLVFIETAQELKQVSHIGLVLSGYREPEGWSNSRSAVDFYDIKGDLEALFALNGCAEKFEFRACTHRALHPGQSADILSDGRVVGRIGALHPELEQSLGLKETAYLAEIEFSAIEAGKLPKFQELSKFPEVRRDLAILVDVSVAWSEIAIVARQAAGEWLTALKTFDVYQSEGIDPDRKSVAIGLTWQHRSRTLTDEEITMKVEQVMASLKNKFNALLRS